MKKLYRRSSLIATIMLLFLGSLALAQERVVTGAITDETGSAMPGVNVLVKGTSTGTASDVDGKFSISVSSDQAVLVFTFVGYASAEIIVGSRSVVNVQMTPDVTTLTELVVTGYAVQQKKDVTGSVGIVKTAELTAIPVGNVSNQLQGRIAGVTVIGNGQPGTTAKVRIRGFGSFENNDPLYVVDGVPTQDISTLNPNDVESISVLKDAGAASIYGSRASNGVVVVTTKRGVSSGISVNYNMYVGTQSPGKGATEDLLNTQQYADLQWLVYKNDGTTETHPIYGPSTNATPSLPNWAGDTDWWDAITDPASIQNHDLSLSGGNTNSKFYAGLNYFDQNGIVNTTFSKRFAARFNSEFKIKDRVTIGENLTMSHRSGLAVGNLDESSPVSMGVYRAQPIIPVRMTTAVTGVTHDFKVGDYGGTGIAPRLGNGLNQVALLERDQDDRAFDIRLIGSVFADVKIIEGLNFKTTFGGTLQNAYFTNYTFATYENAENVATPSFNEGAYYNNDWVWTNTVTFQKQFGDHSLLAVGGYEAVKTNIGRGLNATRAGYFSDAVPFRSLDNGGTITAATNVENGLDRIQTPTTLVSNFLRIDYGFKDKYMLSATIRRDGSSKFGQNNQYGTFPSVTAAWRLSEESFLADNEVITDLKLRGGYGTMGNQLALSPQNQFYLYGGSASTSNYDLNGTGNSSLQGFRPTRIGNPDAKWETNITTNIGFDAGLLGNKLEVVFDWYSKQTQDLLYNPELPAIAGGAAQPFVNIAEMKNTGIDLQIIYRQNISSDVRFEGNLTFTTYKNEIIKLAEGFKYFDWGGSRIGPFNRNEEGRAISEFYGYQVQGLFQSQAEVTSAPTQDGAEPGFFRYADINGDGEIDSDDRVFMGNPNPDFTYGLNLSLVWKGFDLTAFLYGSKGNDIFNFNKWWIDFWPSFQGQKSLDLLNNSWTPERPGASTPKASNKSNFSTNTQSVSYYVENGSFLRMKNIQIGYMIPQDIIGKIGLTTARVYIQGVNLFTATKYSGLDPELGGDDRSFGVDHGNYPVVKQFLVGVNIGL
ncbi:MAG: SusC/RagA family TonB-linked outer membrane protein [Bacteroidota bacterium]